LLCCHKKTDQSTYYPNKAYFGMTDTNLNDKVALTQS